MRNLIDANEVPFPNSNEASKATGDFRSKLIVKTVALAKQKE